VPRLKSDQVFQDCFYTILQTMPGVRSVKIVDDCASAVITYDERQFSPEKVLSGLSEEQILLAEIPLGRDSGNRLRKNCIYKLANTLEAAPPVQFGLGLLSSLAAAFSLPPPVTGGLLILATLPIFGRGVRTLYEEGRPGVDFMDGASVLVLTAEKAYIPAGIMALLIAVGEYIRDIAAKRSEEKLDELLSLSRSSAWLVRKDTRLRVPVEKINEGDALVVYTGEQVPVNALVKLGTATIIPAGSGFDALPVEVGVGDEIRAESIILEGKLYLTCTMARMQPVLDRMMERERRRHLYRTTYQKIALKRAYSVITPIMLFAAGAFLLSRNLNQALTIICFDFVTGIRIALPTAILAYMYRAGKDGVLIKSGAGLEQLATIDLIVFARTGVVTAGLSELTEVVPLAGHSVNELVAAAAAVEYRYHHPVARAIYRFAKQQKLSIAERRNSQLYPGLGVSADLDGRKIKVGSSRFMRQEHVSLDHVSETVATMRARGDSVVYLAFEKELVGVFSYKDIVRREAAEAFQQLKQLGISELIVTSGDAGESVESHVSAIGIARVYSRLSPEEKADLVRDYQLRGKKVAVVGDDVSDALAMAQSDLAIAMSHSTDIARYRAEMIITDDDLLHLPKTIALARQAMAHLRQNLLFTGLPNWLGLLLSVTNAIGPVRATMLNNGSVMLAAVNDLRPEFGHPQTIDLKPLN
jgi:Cu2+-exporting ATPase